jgi:hypothetical protein
VMVKSISEVDSSLGKFDTILMMGNNFGLFGNPKQARRLLERFHDMTSPDARIIAESLDIYNPPVDPVHRRYHLMNIRRGRMPGQVKISTVQKPCHALVRLLARIECRDGWDTARNRLENKAIHSVKESSGVRRNYRERGVSHHLASTLRV